MNRWNKQQDTGWARKNKEILAKRASKRFSLTLERGHERRIREVLQADSCSSTASKFKTDRSSIFRKKELPAL
jgi:hypothetical protein